MGRPVHRYALDNASLFPRLFAQRHCFAESIDDLAGTEVPEYKWIHVASEGEYRGHWQGAFDLTREVFDSFVQNLHDHPQFRAGNLKLGAEPVTCGVKPVIQFDYEHASEMQATEGNIPLHGAPAPGWVCDLEVRDAPDGSAQLWALGKLGDQIRGQMKRNEYRFVSIAFDLKHPNWKTGEDQGPTMTSIAFTNHPFLQDLESYAAANRRPGQVTSDQIQPRASGNEAPSTHQEPSMDPKASAATDDKFRTRLCTALRVRVTLADDDIVDAAEEAASSGGGLKSMLEALGMKDADSAMKVIPELMAKRAQLAELLAEFDTMLQGAQAQEMAMSDTDVAAVMSAKGWKDDGIKTALTAARTLALTNAEEEVHAGARKKLGSKDARGGAVDIIKARATARTEWLKANGVVTEGGVDTRKLSGSVAAGPGGTQLRVDPGKPALGRVISIENDAPDADSEVIDLRDMKGGNPTEKVIKHLSAKDPEFAKLPHFERCKRAAVFQSSHQVLV